ncbi:hypothetical protein M408DRAFT_327626 [Serendipita vermifera MAFF 305830]|uniref:Aminopeptidase P N-terminal domain-containing protein n=1 Tax=Serendipita vermifera MAFF 305830 TaxID=933852 RepID=A0A0C3BIR4_SERVB|nr:hypothetical protein M408DRAFT_327626 [Serendipita vermifera MAFF 305830]
MEKQYPALQHFQKLCAKLVCLLPQSQGTHAVLLRGQQTEYRNDTDRELPFRQESNFFWLTGCDLAGSVALLIYQPEASGGQNTYQTHLFIPHEDPLETLWSPAPPSLQEARQLFDATTIGFTKDFTPRLKEVLDGLSNCLVHTLPASPQFPELAVDLKQWQTSDEYLLTALHQARLTKDAYEIELIRKANDISSRAHELVMRMLGLGVKDKSVHHSNGLSKKKSGPLMPSEWRITREAEAEAAFVASCRREGAVHQAYLPIVAASTRASTLHYCCNDKEFAWGPNSHSDADLVHDHHHDCLAPQVLLIDAGCEWRNYAADITRVTPVGNNGKFTKEAREIYSIVLKMQLACIDAAKPGVHWDHLHLKSHEVLVDEFIKLGIFKGDAKTVLDSGVSAAFYPHGLGHSLGMDVHDVPSASKPAVNDTIPKSSSQTQQLYKYLRLRLPLEANMVVTIEPGCYFSPHQLEPVRGSPHIDHEVLGRYEIVGGVRIEDVVLITETGCEVLTAVRKDVEWLEAVASGAA